MEQYDMKVLVRFNDGTNIEFRATSSYSAAADGRMIYWGKALVDGREYDTYSLPVSTIKSIGEQDIAPQVRE